MNSIEVISNKQTEILIKFIEKGKRKLRIIKAEIEFYKTKLKKIQKIKELKKNFKTLDSCMIHPKNIKIGNLEKCIYSKISIMRYGQNYDSNHSGYIIEQYEPIEGEKVLIEMLPNSELYMDLENINTNGDLKEIRDQITVNGILIEGKILSGRNKINISGNFLNQCNSGKIIVKRETVHQHPYFKDMDEPISIRQLKKTLTENASIDKTY